MWYVSVFVPRFLAVEISERKSVSDCASTQLCNCVVSCYFTISVSCCNLLPEVSIFFPYLFLCLFSFPSFFNKLHVMDTNFRKIQVRVFLKTSHVRRKNAFCHKWYLEFQHILVQHVRTVQI